MIAEEFMVIDDSSPLWQSCSSLMDVALRIDGSDDGYSWNGWNKQQIRNFLHSLPSKSSIVLGVWEMSCGKEHYSEREELAIGLVFEVIDGDVYSVRTFDALKADGLKPSNQLEAGIDDAREIIRHAEKVVAPVAWALFLEKTTWDEWLFETIDIDAQADKAQQLEVMTNQGRCVILGSKTRYV